MASTHGPDSGGRTGHPWRAWARPAALVAAVAALAVLARATGVGAQVAGVREWVLSLGPWAPAAFVAVYAAGVVLAVPGSLLTVAAGAMFGSVLGVVLVSIASTLGATLAFVIARFLARDAVSRWLSGNARFARLDRLTREHGAAIVAVTRLVPLFPFNLLNYGFGLTRVRLGTYVFWSWLCMLPGTVLYVVGADTVTTALARHRIPWTLVIAFVVAATLLAAIARRARRVLAQRHEEPQPGGDAP